MEYRILGKSGLKVSEISLGCWTIGGPAWHNGQPDGWTGNDDASSLRGLRKAYECGINHFDTADSYGTGHSERLIGQLLREIPRDRVIVASKVGAFRGTAPCAMQPLHIRHQLEQTLSNLNTDYVDIYYFHNANFGPGDLHLEEAADTVRALQKEGKIRVIGQSAYRYQDFQRVCPQTRPEVLQFHYNALGNEFDRPETDLFSWAEQQNLGMVMFGPLAQGLLLDKFDIVNPPQFGEGDTRSNQKGFTKEGLTAIRRKLQPIKERFGSSAHELIRVFLQYGLSKSKNASVIPGFKNDRQVATNAMAAGKPLTEEEVQFIRRHMQNG